MRRLDSWSRKIAIMIFTAFVLALLPMGVADAASLGLGIDPDFDPPLAALAPYPGNPKDNPASNNIFPMKMGPKQELGYLLWFDAKLTGDMSVSCGTCHHPDTGWGFPDQISRGYPGTVHWRNSQTVINTGYLQQLFWAGSATSLEKQAPQANKGGVAGNGESDMMESRLRMTPEYVKRWKATYGNVPHIKDAWRAVSVFERYLSQPCTPFDMYMKGNKGALSASAKRGKSLFEGKANCAECHNGAMFTDEKFYNVGVEQPSQFLESGLNQITFRFEIFAKGVTEELYRTLKDDPGVYFRDKNEKNLGKFRTAPIRYGVYAAPYMHTGVFFDYNEVVDFYNKGGGTNIFTAKTKTKIVKPLNLSDAEKADVVAFLESLSGKEIKMKVSVSPPMEAFSNWQPKK